ncbi:Conserved oligomeric Golgi complex subunit 2 (COG complex subunit 2) (Component of oligomeric Golgi complex 2) [Durusdinium trenchii]|uniref:Conserved oligomeric Golgi complex subunit 2 n=1 Tax=Durusdinium trenchii TaxID=1381693 RepID=A0ABP0SAY0_9DINO
MALGRDAELEDALFLGEDWDAARFVAGLRAERTLETLEQDLEAYVASLDNTLVNIINNDYSSFLKLSSMLVDIDSLVAGLREPLNQLEHKVGAVRAVVATPLQAQQDIVDKLTYVREKKRLIQLCLSAWETLEKVERQVEELQVTTSQVVRGEALGRATQRLARVTFLAQENSELPVLRMVRAKARSLEQALIEELDKALVQAIEADHASIAVVLRAYVAIDQVEKAGHVFQDRVIKPNLERMFTQGKVDAGGARGLASGLAAVYRESLVFLNDSCRPVLDAVRDPEEGLQVDFVGSSMAQAAAAVIKDNLAFVYTSGVADTLFSSYRATEAFFGVLAALSADRSKVDAIATDVLQLWNLSVYIQLRSQEFAAQLDKALETPIDVDNLDPDADGLTIPASRQLLSCFLKCWGQGVYLGPVALKILKLAFQLITSFAAWAEASVGFFSGEQDQCDASKAWAGVPCEALVVLASDCTNLEAALHGHLDMVCDRVGPQDATHARKHVRKAFSDVVYPRLRALSQDANHAVHASLTSACNDRLLQGLKSVAPMYRMTNKPAPTDPSDYATQVLEPLQSFLGGPISANMGTQDRQACIEAVLGSLFSFFEEQAVQVLDEIKTTENALRRLKRNASARQMDSDKIKIQYRLDVESIARHAQDVGADLADIPSLAHLRDFLQQE